MTSTSVSAQHPSVITEILVEDLFGLYNYTLASEPVQGPEHSRLLILYGDNGSGKTTLLKLIFNLLSKADKQGHRTYLANTPFRRFTVRLGGSTHVSAERANGKITGSYRISIREPSVKPFHYDVKVSARNTVLLSEQDAVGYPELLRRLAALNLDLYYLGDDRKAYGSSPPEQDGSDVPEFIYVQTEDNPEGVPDVRRADRAQGPVTPQEVLQLALRRLEFWIAGQVIQGSSAGEVNTNTIYVEIVKRIARAVGMRRSPTQTDENTLAIALRELEDRTKRFSEFDLIAPLDASSLLAVLQGASASKRPIITSVLTPYVDGLKARLDALQDVQNVVRVFIESINSFLTNKGVSFKLGRGIEIHARNGQRLDPSMLSSGERQILLLFSNIVTARIQSSIFIIDEPELSLNVKWQRRLLSSLLDCTKATPVQFIVATHSIELLARHRPHVLRLSGATDS